MGFGLKTLHRDRVFADQVWAAANVVVGLFGLVHAKVSLVSAMPEPPAPPLGCNVPLWRYLLHMCGFAVPAQCIGYLEVWIAY